MICMYVSITLGLEGQHMREKGCKEVILVCMYVCMYVSYLSII